MYGKEKYPDICKLDNFFLKHKDQFNLYVLIVKHMHMYLYVYFHYFFFKRTFLKLFHTLVLTHDLFAIDT